MSNNENGYWGGSLGGLWSEGGEATGTEQATQAADFKADVRHYISISYRIN